MVKHNRLPRCRRGSLFSFLMFFPPSIRLSQQLLRTLQQSWSHRRAANKPRQLLPALFPVQPLQIGVGAALPFSLTYLEVSVRHSSQLRQVGDTQHLLVPGHLSHLFGYLLGLPAGDAGIHLVKDQGADLVVLSQYIF